MSRKNPDDKQPTLGLVPVARVLPNLPAVKRNRPVLKPDAPTGLRVIQAAENADPQDILYQHTVFCQACLPYRDPGPNVFRWERDNGNISLLVTSKEVKNPITDKWMKLGLPYGPKSRLFFADINTQAILTGKPEIDLEKTLTRYVKHLQLDPCGRNITRMKQIISRSCSSQIQIALSHEGKSLQTDTQLMRGFEIWFPKDQRQRVIWPSWATLSLDYFEILLSHGVPLNEAHYVALSHSAMAMDIYAWLAQRLHRLKVPYLIYWNVLYRQFGWNYDRLRDFRRVFTTALKQVLAVYQDAKVEADDNGRGLWLRQSRPPVLKNQILLPK